MTLIGKAELPVAIPTAVSFPIFFALAQPDFFGWLERWQTLFGAFLALIGAWLTVRKIRDQITLADAHRQDELDRERRAALVTLPLTLSEVSEVVKQMADEVATAFELKRQAEAEAGKSLLLSAVQTPPFKSVDLPAKAVSSFQEIVRALSKKDEIKHIAQLIAVLQILFARYRSFDPESANGERAFVSLLIDCARVSHLNDSLYSFARAAGEGSFSVISATRKEAWEEIRGRSHSLLFFRENPDPMMIEANKMIDGYLESGVSPWVKA